MPTPIHVLILADRTADAELMLNELRRAGYEPDWQRVDTERGFLSRSSEDLDLILSVYSLPKLDALHALRLLQERDLDIPLIVISDGIGEEAAVECIRQGAADCLLKDQIARLAATVARVLQEKELRDESRQTEQALQERERRHRELAGSLRESEKRYRNIIELAPNGIMTMDLKGVITSCNPAFLKLTGYSKNEIVGKHFTKQPTLRARDIPRYAALMSSILRGNIPRPIEFAWAHKDGSTRWGEAHVSLTRKGSRVTGLVAIIGDITERRRGEQWLRALNQAALIMERAFVPEEIFAAVSKSFNALGVSCLLLPTDESQSRLFTKYVSFDAKIIKAGERLSGLKRERFVIRVEDVDVYKEVVWEGKTVFIENGEDVMRQVLPGPVKRLAGQLVSILGMRRAIVTPLIVEDSVAGVLSVQAADLTEADVPFVSAFAFQVAAAWHRAQLFERAQQQIVERTRAQEMLRESEERLQLALDAATDGLYDWNMQTGEAYFSPRYYTMLGYAPYELPPSYDTWIDLLHPDDRERAVAVVDEYLESGRESHEIEFRLRTKSGGWRWILSRGRTSERDADAGPIRMVGTHVDVTERRQAEDERERLLAQIQEQARRVQQIIDTVPEGVLVLDAGRRIVLVNPTLGKNPDVLAGAQVGDTLTHIGDRPLMALLTSPPEGLWHEVTVTSSASHDGMDGERSRTFEGIARPLARDAGPEGWVLVLRDVTQEREIQQRVQQQERLAAVGQLAAGIAHDFNNILAVIALYAQMLVLAPGLSARDRERTSIINQQATQAANLIQQILDFSRRAVLERQSLDLAPLLKEQINLLERTLPENIRIDLVYGPDEHTISADPTRIQQAVMNLALNARDAMPEGGRLHIGLERMWIGSGEEVPLPEMEPGEWVQVTVSDTGAGITPEALPHVFEPFFTTKSPGKGSGLGLAQVYGIVRQHQGHVDVKSEVGKGTTFTAYLPALPRHELEFPVSAEMMLAEGAGEVILVVEDNAATRQAVMESLELLNYRTKGVADGQEALEILDRQHDEVGDADRIALVLTDVVMPRMGGLALLHALRERELGIGVVMMSGHPPNKELVSLHAAGAVGWMAKPPSLNQLAEAVANTLKGGSTNS